MICLVLDRPTLAANIALLRTHLSRIDAAELRLDLIDASEWDAAIGLPATVAGLRSDAEEPLPLIATARRATDGGSFAGTEEGRRDLLAACAVAGFEWITAESDLLATPAGDPVTRAARGAGCGVMHASFAADLAAGGLATTIRALAGEGMIARVEVRPASVRDLLEILEAAESTREVRKIIDVTGPYGAPFRVLTRRIGSMLTFVRDAGDSPAADHIGPPELEELYRFREITHGTRLFGIIGSPIAHSRSPEYHNAGFIREGLDACYLRFLVDDVRDFFTLAGRLPMHGFSVTLPHKEAVLPFLADVDAGVRAAGSCNTVIRPLDDPDIADRWVGVNTDVPGFLAPLNEELGTGIAGMGATVIGAGGAARAVVLALLQSGVSVKVLNRTTAKAEALTGELAAFVPASGLSVTPRLTVGALSPGSDLGGYRDIVVQTTNLGMHGEGDPVPWLELDGTELVYDIVYTPPETPLILRARAAGCRTITGDRMFAAQAAAQFELFSRLTRA